MSAAQRGRVWLRRLIGERLQSLHQVGDMTCLRFCDPAGERWRIHILGSWRLEKDGVLVAGQMDLFEEEAGVAPGSVFYSLLEGALGKRWDGERGGVLIENVTDAFVVETARVSRWGDFELGLSGGWTMRNVNLTGRGEAWVVLDKVHGLGFTMELGEGESGVAVDLEAGVWGGGGAGVRGRLIPKRDG